MALFVDTSAILAIIDADDERHAEALGVWSSLADRSESAITSNYVLVEATAVLSRRLGFQAVRLFQTDIVPVLSVRWIDEVTHERAVAALLTAGRRDLSLVDCVSFEVMRQLGLDSAFAFDAHFLQQGFRCFP